MNYSIDHTSKIPAYIQLYDMMRRDIVSGAYPHGSRLPSKRTVASETGVSVITVEHAAALLCEEGYAEARERSGLYVVYRRDDFQGTPAPAAAEPRRLPAQLHNSGDFPYSVLAKTMRRVLLDYGDRILVKSPNHGCPELRTEICAYLKRSRAISVKPSQIIVGSGAEYLYGLIAQLLGRGRVFALEQPSYDKIRRVYRSFGIECDMLPLRADGLDSAALGSTGAAVLHVTPFNSYPSGITVSVSKKHEYLRWAQQRGGVIIEDNYDSELTVSRKSEDSLFSMSEDGRVIYVNTFSKTVAPSMRIGYMILPERLEEEFNEKLGFYSCTVPVFEQYVLADLLRSGSFEKHVNRVRRKRRREAASGAEKNTKGGSVK